MVVVPDVMAGVARSIEILTAPGDGVVITPPVYGPFSRTIERLGRRPVEAPVVLDSGGWRLDLEAVEAAFTAGARAIVLCNPHNPTGALPSAAELLELRELAARFGAGIISDEVHGPLTLAGPPLHPAALAGRSSGDLTVTSASKAWNVAGIEVRARHRGRRASGGGARPGFRSSCAIPATSGALAATAAFASAAAGDGWLDAGQRAICNASTIGRRLCSLRRYRRSRSRASTPAICCGWTVAPLGLGDDPAADIPGPGQASRCRPGSNSAVRAADLRG